MSHKEISIGKIVSLSEEYHKLFSVMLEIQSGCNWRCKHCYVDHYSYRLSTDEIFKLLISLRKMGCFEITLTGGEVFFRNDIFEIINQIRELGFNLVIFTNASLLDAKKIELLSLYNVDLLSCTLFSTKSDIHDSITQVTGSLNIVLNNLDLLKKQGIPVQVKSIIMKPNYDSYDALKEYCDEMGFRFKPDFAVYRKLDGDDRNQELILDEEQLAVIIRNADIVVGYTPVYVNRESDFVCKQTQHSLSIDWHGNIHPCNRLSCVLGNIKNDDIETVWNNSYLLRDIQNKQWKDLTKCCQCKKLTYCVRCAGGALEEAGNMLDASSVACRIANARAVAYKESFIS
ncbi:MAG: radical SAM protein [Clostridium sp.]|jgi:radical SAM protein with 4Fe4S-binding SPASM domain|nr:radical SAM protein [Clostridium sp.]